MPRVFPALVVLVLAVGACSSSSSSSPESAGVSAETALPAPPVLPADADEPGPVTERDGQPAGFARTEAGAAAAATTYLSTLHRLLEADSAERSAAVQAIAAAGTDAVVDEAMLGFDLLDDMVDQARTEDPEARLLVRGVPVAFTVAGYRDDRARVEVWTLGVLVIEGQTLATEVWSTNDVELVWEDDDWRLWSWQRRSGPTPTVAAVEPVAPSELLDAIEGWEGYRYVPAP